MNIHISDKEIDRLIKTEPDTTIRQYLDLLNEISQIKDTHE